MTSTILWYIGLWFIGMFPASWVIGYVSPDLKSEDTLASILLWPIILPCYVIGAIGALIMMPFVRVLARLNVYGVRRRRGP